MVDFEVVLDVIFYMLIEKDHVVFEYKLDAFLYAVPLPMPGFKTRLWLGAPTERIQMVREQAAKDAAEIKAAAKKKTHEKDATPAKKTEGRASTLQSSGDHDQENVRSVEL